MLQCLEGEPLQWRAMIRLMLDTGCRRGEPCGLRWRSVDFANNTIKIENNLEYTPGKGVYATTPKSGADVASVSAKLGHAEVSTTLNFYTHANQESVKQANEIYRQALKQKEA